MSTYDLSENAEFRSARVPGFFSVVALGFQASARRLEERRILARLSRLNSRLLKDMGLDPEAIYEAVDGTWDELPATQRFPRV